MDWHKTLMSNEACSHGDSEFHNSLLRGNVLEKMLTLHQRDQVFEFFRDSFLERLDTERSFVRAGSQTPAYGWIYRFNSLGLVMRSIDLLWEPWWSVETPGRAVCVLQYCSGLIYCEGENPVFDPWTHDKGGGGPYLAANDCYVPDHGWKQPNIEFLQHTLSVDYVLKKVEQAADRLANEPERDVARQIAADAATNHETVELLIEELPQFLMGERRV